MSESNPVALVTGASSGIGATFARALAGRGFDLILVARRADRLAQLARELETAAGVRAAPLAADLALDSEMARVEERIAGEGKLEVLVNNAGFGSRGMFFNVDRASQDRMHRVHVLATLRLTHAALAGMVARNRGRIVNVSSVAAFGSTPGGASYSATKAWMNSFTEALALELRCAGSAVRVQALCPGFTITEFHESLGIDRKTIPGSWWMQAEDVVRTSLRAMDSGKLFVVPGLLYKVIVLLSKLTPRPLRHAAVVRYARRTKRL
jgi:short-subunit dehydrogenase